MPISPRKKELIEALKAQARVLYAQGYDLRTVGQKVGRSHTWVWNVVKKSNVSQPANQSSLDAGSQIEPKN